MFDQVIELTKLSKVYFLKHSHRRLLFESSLATSCLLFTLCAIVTSQQYFGKPIECMQSLKDNSIPESVLNKFCFISMTYIPVEFKVPPEIDKAKHSFYPWVPLVLLLQGLSFLLPLNVWSYIDSGFLEKCLEDRNSLLIDNKKLQPLGRYLAHRMSSFRVWSLGYILSEFVYVINVVLNFILTDVFLGGSFLQYGLQVFHKNLNIGNTMFPSTTRCIFNKYGPSGTLENRDVLCLMTLNMWNQRFYLFLWFWFLFLLIKCVIFVLHRTCFLIVIMMRKKCICLIKFMLTPNLGCNGVLTIINRLTFTDWIFIQQLKRSMYTSTYNKLLENIVIEMTEPHNLIFNGVKEPRVCQRKEMDLLHSNSNV